MQKKISKIIKIPSLIFILDLVKVIFYFFIKIYECIKITLFMYYKINRILFNQLLHKVKYF